MLSIKEIRDGCMAATYSRGRNLFLDGKVYDIDLHENDIFIDEMEMKCRVKGSGSKWYEVSLSLNEEMDEILETSCECPAFETYFGMCKHCVAAALALRQRQIDEQKSLKGAARITPAGRKNLLPLEKETSNVLKNMIEKYAVRGHGHLLGGYYKEVSLIPEISKEYRGYSIEFKIGVKKMYVLKNIPKLIYDVEKNNFVAYGKNFSFLHDRSAFTDEALSWIDVIGDILKTTTGQTNFDSYIYGSDHRTINLTPYGMERILEKSLGGDIIIDGRRWMVEERNPRMTLHIKPLLNRGAYLSMDGREYIQGVHHLYVMEEQSICRCSGEFAEEVQPLAMTLGGLLNYYQNSGDSLYLNKSDYEGFCGNVLPRISKYIELDNQGVDFEEYMPKEPVFSVYLSESEEKDREILARAEAAYGGTTFPVPGDMDLAGSYRDMAREHEFSNLLSEYFEEKEEKDGVILVCKREEDIYRLVSEGIERLKEQAQVFIDDKLRGIKIVNSPYVTVGVSLTGELLDLDVSVEDLDMNEIYEILSAYRTKKKYYRMKNGDFMRMEDNGMAVLSELTQGLHLSKDDLAQGKIQVPGYRTNYIDTVLKRSPENMEIKRNSDFKRIIRNMRDYCDSDFEVPSDLKAKLRGYQKDGFRWLSTLAAWGFGGILADDMGLGKTVQMLAFLLSVKGRALIVCPASLIYNWESEAGRFAPGLKTAVVIGSGEERKREIENSKDVNIVITSYDLLKRDIEHYGDQIFDYMIIDEAQYIKNAGTQAAKTVKRIRAKERFAMTGTPIENRLSDLWSIFDFIMPGYLYSYSEFKEELELPAVKEEDEDALKRLQSLIGPFILRRRKQDVLKDLPEKLEEVVYTSMNSEQKTLYRAQVDKLRAELAQTSDEEFGKDSIRYLAALTRLRQLCCSPELIYENYRGGSGKLDTCMELVSSALEGNHKLLLFSQFTQMLDLIGKRLQQMRIPYLYLSGRDGKSKRQEMVERFQAGEIGVFLISLKAGGVGLNLTAADIVIHYDPWWNVAAQNQATDRTHRIGQKNVVNVMKLVARDTIEERILELQKRKAQLSENVIEGGSVLENRLSREEILGLLDHVQKK